MLWILACLACTDSDGAAQDTDRQDTDLQDTGSENQAPSVSIAEPLLDTVARGGTIVFSAAILDDKDGPEDLVLTWTSDLDGVLTLTSLGETQDYRFEGTLSPGAHQLTLQVQDRGGLTDQDSRSITINGAPAAAQIALSPVNPTTLDSLEVLVETEPTDPEEDTLTLRYQWFLDGAESGASTGPTLSPEFTVKGQSWALWLTASDALGPGTTATAQVLILNTLPTLPGVEINPSASVEAEPLVCSVSTASTDVDGDTLVYSYAWEADGAAYPDDFAGAVGPASTVSSNDTVPAADTDLADVFTCLVTTDDGEAWVQGSAEAEVGVTPTAIGYSTAFSGSSTHAANYLLGHPVSVSSEVTVFELAFYSGERHNYYLLSY